MKSNKLNQSNNVVLTNVVDKVIFPNDQNYIEEDINHLQSLISYKLLKIKDRYNSK